MKKRISVILLVIYFTLFAGLSALLFVSVHKTEDDKPKTPTPSYTAKNKLADDFAWKDASEGNAQNIIIPSGTKLVAYSGKYSLVERENGSESEEVLIDSATGEIIDLSDYYFDSIFIEGELIVLHKIVDYVLEEHTFYAFLKLDSNLEVQEISVNQNIFKRNVTPPTIPDSYAEYEFVNNYLIKTVTNYRNSVSSITLYPTSNGLFDINQQIILGDFINYTISEEFLIAYSVNKTEVFSFDNISEKLPVFSLGNVSVEVNVENIDDEFDFFWNGKYYIFSEVNFVTEISNDFLMINKNIAKQPTTTFIWDLKNNKVKNSPISENFALYSKDINGYIVIETSKLFVYLDKNFNIVLSHDKLFGTINFSFGKYFVTNNSRIINFEGKMVALPEGLTIYPNKYNNGYFLASIDNKFGFVDSNFNKVSKFEFDNLYSYDNKNYIGEKDGEFYFVNISSKTLIQNLLKSEENLNLLKNEAGYFIVDTQGDYGLVGFDGAIVKTNIDNFRINSSRLSTQIYYKSFPEEVSENVFVSSSYHKYKIIDTDYSNETISDYKGIEPSSFQSAGYGYFSGDILVWENWKFVRKNPYESLKINGKSVERDRNSVITVKIVKENSEHVIDTWTGKFTVWEGKVFGGEFSSGNDKYYTAGIDITFSTNRDILKWVVSDELHIKFTSLSDSLKLSDKSTYSFAWVRDWNNKGAKDNEKLYLYGSKDHYSSTLNPDYDNRYSIKSKYMISPLDINIVLIAKPTSLKSLNADGGNTDLGAHAYSGEQITSNITTNLSNYQSGTEFQNLVSKLSGADSDNDRSKKIATQLKLHGFYYLNNSTVNFVSANIDDIKDHKVFDEDGIPVVSAFYNEKYLPDGKVLIPIYKRKFEFTHFKKDANVVTEDNYIYFSINANNVDLSIDRIAPTTSNGFLGWMSTTGSANTKVDNVSPYSWFGDNGNQLYAEYKRNISFEYKKEIIHYEHQVLLSIYNINYQYLTTVNNGIVGLATTNPAYIYQYTSAVNPLDRMACAVIFQGDNWYIYQITQFPNPNTDNNWHANNSAMYRGTSNEFFERNNKVSKALVQKEGQNLSVFVEQTQGTGHQNIIEFGKDANNSNYLIYDGNNYKLGSTSQNADTFNRDGSSSQIIYSNNILKYTSSDASGSKYELEYSIVDNVVSVAGKEYTINSYSAYQVIDGLTYEWSDDGLKKNFIVKNSQGIIAKFELSNSLNQQGYNVNAFIGNSTLTFNTDFEGYYTGNVLSISNNDGIIEYKVQGTVMLSIQTNNKIVYQGINYHYHSDLGAYISGDFVRKTGNAIRTYSWDEETNQWKTSVLFEHNQENGSIFYDGETYNLLDENEMTYAAGLGLTKTRKNQLYYQGKIYDIIDDENNTKNIYYYLNKFIAIGAQIHEYELVSYDYSINNDGEAVSNKTIENIYLFELRNSLNNTNFLYNDNNYIYNSTMGRFNHLSENSHTEQVLVWKEGNTFDFYSNIVNSPEKFNTITIADFAAENNRLTYQNKTFTRVDGTDLFVYNTNEYVSKKYELVSSEYNYIHKIGDVGQVVDLGKVLIIGNNYNIFVESRQNTRFVIEGLGKQAKFVNYLDVSGQNIKIEEFRLETQENEFENPGTYQLIYRLYRGEDSTTPIVDKDGKYIDNELTVNVLENGNFKFDFEEELFVEEIPAYELLFEYSSNAWVYSNGLYSERITAHNIYNNSGIPTNVKHTYNVFEYLYSSNESELYNVVEIAGYKFLSRKFAQTELNQNFSYLNNGLSVTEEKSKPNIIKSSIKHLKSEANKNVVFSNYINGKPTGKIDSIFELSEDDAVLDGYLWKLDDENLFFITSDNNEVYDIHNNNVGFGIKQNIQKYFTDEESALEYTDTDNFRLTSFDEVVLERVNGAFTNTGFKMEIESGVIVIYFNTGISDTNYIKYMTIDLQKGIETVKIDAEGNYLEGQFEFKGFKDDLKQYINIFNFENSSKKIEILRPKLNGPISFITYTSSNYNESSKTGKTIEFIYNFNDNGEPLTEEVVINNTSNDQIVKTSRFLKNLQETESKYLPYQRIRIDNNKYLYESLNDEGQYVSKEIFSVVNKVLEIMDKKYIQIREGFFTVNAFIITEDNSAKLFSPQKNVNAFDSGAIIYQARNSGDENYIQFESTKYNYITTKNIDFYTSGSYLIKNNNQWLGFDSTANNKFSVNFPHPDSDQWNYTKKIFVAKGNESILFDYTSAGLLSTIFVNNISRFYFQEHTESDLFNRQSGMGAYKLNGTIRSSFQSNVVNYSDNRGIIIEKNNLGQIIKILIGEQIALEMIGGKGMNTSGSSLYYYNYDKNNNLLSRQEYTIDDLNLARYKNIDGSGDFIEFNGLSIIKTNGDSEVLGQISKNYENNNAINTEFLLSTYDYKFNKISHSNLNIQYIIKLAGLQYELYSATFKYGSNVYGFVDEANNKGINIVSKNLKNIITNVNQFKFNTDAVITLMFSRKPMSLISVDTFYENGALENRNNEDENSLDFETDDSYGLVSGLGTDIVMSGKDYLIRGMTGVLSDIHLERGQSSSTGTMISGIRGTNRLVSLIPDSSKNRYIEKIIIKQKDNNSLSLIFDWNPQTGRVENVYLINGVVNTIDWNSSPLSFRDANNNTLSVSQKISLSLAKNYITAGLGVDTIKIITHDTNSSQNGKIDLIFEELVVDKQIEVVFERKHYENTFSINNNSSFTGYLTQELYNNRYTDKDARTNSSVGRDEFTYFSSIYSENKAMSLFSDFNAQIRASVSFGTKEIYQTAEKISGYYIKTINIRNKSNNNLIYKIDAVYNGETGKVVYYNQGVVLSPSAPILVSSDGSVFTFAFVEDASGTFMLTSQNSRAPLNFEFVIAERTIDIGTKAKDNGSNAQIDINNNKADYIQGVEQIVKADIASSVAIRINPFNNKIINNIELKYGNQIIANIHVGFYLKESKKYIWGNDVLSYQNSNHYILKSGESAENFNQYAIAVEVGGTALSWNTNANAFIFDGWSVALSKNGEIVISRSYSVKSIAVEFSTLNFYKVSLFEAYENNIDSNKNFDFVAANALPSVLPFDRILVNNILVNSSVYYVIGQKPTVEVYRNAQYILIERDLSNPNLVVTGHDGPKSFYGDSNTLNIYAKRSSNILTITTVVDKGNSYNFSNTYVSVYDWNSNRVQSRLFPASNTMLRIELVPNSGIVPTMESQGKVKYSLRYQNTQGTFDINDAVVTIEQGKVVVLFTTPSENEGDCTIELLVSFETESYQRTLYDGDKAIGTLLFSYNKNVLMFKPLNTNQFKSFNEAEAGLPLKNNFTYKNLYTIKNGITTVITNPENNTVLKNSYIGGDAGATYFVNWEAKNIKVNIKILPTSSIAKILTLYANIKYGSNELIYRVNNADGTNSDQYLLKNIVPGEQPYQYIHSSNNQLNVQSVTLTEQGYVIKLYTPWLFEADEDDITILFQSIDYTATYHIVDGENITEKIGYKDYTKQHSTAAQHNPKIGYEFIGWSLVSFNEIAIANDLSFIIQGFNGRNELVMTTFNSLGDPIYNFFYQQNLVEITFSKPYPSSSAILFEWAENVVFYPVYMVKEYSVEFLPNNNKDDSFQIPVTFGQKIDLSGVGVPTKEGANFIGYGFDKDKIVFVGEIIGDRTVLKINSESSNQSWFTQNFDAEGNFFGTETLVLSAQYNTIKYKIYLNNKFVKNVEYNDINIGFAVPTIENEYLSKISIRNSLGDNLVFGEYWHNPRTNKVDDTLHEKLKYNGQEIDWNYSSNWFMFEKISEGMYYLDSALKGYRIDFVFEYSKLNLLATMNLSFAPSGTSVYNNTLYYAAPKGKSVLSSWVQVDVDGKIVENGVSLIKLKIKMEIQDKEYEVYVNAAGQYYFDYMNIRYKFDGWKNSISGDEYDFADEIDLVSNVSLRGNFVPVNSSDASVQYYVWDTTNSQYVTYKITYEGVNKKFPVLNIGHASGIRQYDVTYYIAGWYKSNTIPTGGYLSVTSTTPTYDVGKDAQISGNEKWYAVYKKAVFEIISENYSNSTYTAEVKLPLSLNGNSYSSNDVVWFVSQDKLTSTVIQNVTMLINNNNLKQVGSGAYFYTADIISTQLSYLVAVIYNKDSQEEILIASTLSNQIQPIDKISLSTESNDGKVTSNNADKYFGNYGLSKFVWLGLTYDEKIAFEQNQNNLSDYFNKKHEERIAFEKDHKIMFTYSRLLQAINAKILDDNSRILNKENIYTLGFQSKYMYIVLALMDENNNIKLVSSTVADIQRFIPFEIALSGSNIINRSSPELSTKNHFITISLTKTQYDEYLKNNMYLKGILLNEKIDEDLKIEEGRSASVGIASIKYSPYVVRVFTDEKNLVIAVSNALSIKTYYENQKPSIQRNGREYTATLPAFASGDRQGDFYYSWISLTPYQKQLYDANNTLKSYSMFNANYSVKEFNKGLLSTFSDGISFSDNKTTYEVKDSNAKFYMAFVIYDKNCNIVTISTIRDLVNQDKIYNIELNIKNSKLSVSAPWFDSLQEQSIIDQSGTMLFDRIQIGKLGTKVEGKYWVLIFPINRVSETFTPLEGNPVSNNTYGAVIIQNDGYVFNEFSRRESTGLFGIDGKVTTYYFGFISNYVTV